MSVMFGSGFVLRKGNGEMPVETFSNIAGMRVVNFSCKNNLVEANGLSSGKWRKLLEGAGRNSVSISGSGTFHSSVSEEQVRALALSGAVKNYQIEFENGDKLTGAFIISSYQRGVTMDERETVSLTLESAGAVEYAVAV